MIADDYIQRVVQVFAEVIPLVTRPDEAGQEHVRQPSSARSV